MAERDENARSKVPQPPEGHGPMLEWHYSTRGNRWFQTLLMPAIIFVLYTLWDWGFGWMQAWYLWVILAAGGLFYFWHAKPQGMAAGVDWFTNSDDRVLGIYELVKVKMSVGGTGRWLDLEDAQGNTLYINEVDLQQNPDLWDLVYNGILHSVHVGGAETNKIAERQLELNNPPFLRGQT